MSERDFEIYLSLLGRFLRLSGPQRESIEAELRDHMEQRLDELLEHGLTREEAIATALDEFGDAAGLAHRFSTLAHQHRRRLIMRYSFASLCALALAATIFLSMLPERHDISIQPFVVAQQQAEPESAEQTTASPPRPAGRSPAAMTAEQRLSTSIDVAYDGIPFVDFINDLRERTGANIVVKSSALDHSGVDLSYPVSIRISSVPASKVLQLVLEMVGGELTPLDYVIDEDGIVILSTVENLNQYSEIRMYNVSDLVGEEPLVTAPTGGGFSGLGGFAGSGGTPRAPSSPLTGSTALIPLLQEQIEPETWRANGGLVGVVSYYNKTLIVRHTPKVHEQVYRFLQMLRQARAAEVGDVISGLSVRSPVAPSTPGRGLPGVQRRGGRGFGPAESPGLGGFGPGLPGVRATPSSDR